MGCVPVAASAVIGLIRKSISCDELWDGDSLSGDELWDEEDDLLKPFVCTELAAAGSRRTAVLAVTEGSAAEDR